MNYYSFGVLSLEEQSLPKFCCIQYSPQTLGPEIAYKYITILNESMGNSGGVVFFFSPQSFCFVLKVIIIKR